MQGLYCRYAVGGGRGGGRVRVGRLRGCVADQQASKQQALRRASNQPSIHPLSPYSVGTTYLRSAPPGRPTHPKIPLLHAHPPRSPTADTGSLATTLIGFNAPSTRTTQRNATHAPNAEAERQLARAPTAGAASTRVIGTARSPRRLCASRRRAGR
ncbi:uncharacterized protein K452DRAFT_63920 [Aplosporella prunicola CBS 121167]|uniref:Uncharacterized protein n=1 Tax=Aplosporella prunicola CBS 121167 TaxID=1176127 RepID=A0A6A6B6D2_9PEZI|nr:uncharacterized protein K452DRAFT_63920 [Aplosporella prunicola CBS 121167]KAF2139682.1 hypothetical protein K452DRAFT_63920 [Aplosporella prunicola CBS 121167]